MSARSTASGRFQSTGRSRSRSRASRGGETHAIRTRSSSSTCRCARTTARFWASRASSALAAPRRRGPFFGADKFDHGAIRIDGKPVHFYGPRDAMTHGIGLVPEDRKKQALFLRLAIRTNITIAAQDQISRGWFIDERREDRLIDEFRRQLSIRMASPDQAAGLLSGGNQQKVVLARWLALRPKILIVDEPTRGIDVGSKVEVHNLLIEMAKQGIAVIVISSELPEILAVSDRIITMREGRVTGEIARGDATQEILMSMMTFHERAGEARADGLTRRP